MKTHLIILSSILLCSAFISCTKKSFGDAEVQAVAHNNDNGLFRSYDEAELLANSVTSMLGEITKSPSRRILGGSCFTMPSTKSEESIVDSLYYVFNYANNEGFAVINADKYADPFICVTETGYYDLEKGTGVPAVDDYFDNVQKQLSSRFHPIDSLIEIDDPIPPYSYTVTVYDGTSVSPLISTKWGQIDVYGAYCQYGNCSSLATAIGQIMNRFKYPNSITLSAPMGSYSAGDVITMSWYYVGLHTEEHTSVQYCSPYHYQISALLRDIGGRAHVNYFSSGLCGFMFNNALIPLSYYGYSYSNVSTVNVATIKSSLDNGRLVLMRGGASSGGQHVWVADGYKDYIIYKDTYAQAGEEPGYILVHHDYFGEVHALHINWGWDGYCNGYFNFNTYNTGAAVSYDGPVGSTTYNFSSDLQMIANIYH